MPTISTEPPRLGLTLCVDEQAVGQGPLVRGDGPPHLIRDGHRVSEQSEMRRTFRTVLGSDGHVARFRAAHPERTPLAVVGCGNLGLNIGVRAWVDGRWLGAEGPEGGAVAVDLEGRGRRVPIGDEPEDAWVITGPDLVRDGRPALSHVTTFADPRHRVLFPYVETASGNRVDFGHDRLIADAALYEDAAAGRLVHLPTDGAPHDALRDALAVKGYADADAPGQPGTYRLRGDTLEIVFFPGLYPHHALAISADGIVTSWVIPGLSNRAGITVHALAARLAASGARDAILLDNGGDVGFWRADPGEWVVRPAEPDREDAWPLSACLVYSAAPSPDRTSGQEP
ncbi:MAG: phosphodiester glycosidase family protein [Planctomycetes bacterium]|nr:phosphodiester glycosidase family protein [Planctomycetota bacterium]